MIINIVGVYNKPTEVHYSYTTGNARIMNPYGNIIIRVASDLGNCFHEIYTITTSNTQLYPGNHAQGRALTNEK